MERTLALLQEHKIVLIENEIDIIGLSETQLDETVRDVDVYINGYNAHRNHLNANGGEVAIYVKDNFPEPTIKINCVIVGNVRNSLTLGTSSKTIIAGPKKNFKKWDS